MVKQLTYNNWRKTTAVWAATPREAGWIQTLAAVSISEHLPFKRAQKLHAVQLSRPAAGWVRLVVLLTAFDYVEGFGLPTHGTFASAGRYGPDLTDWSREQCCEIFHSQEPIGISAHGLTHLFFGILLAFVLVVWVCCPAVFWVPLDSHDSVLRCKGKAKRVISSSTALSRLGVAGLSTYLCLCGFLPVCCVLGVGVSTSSRATYHRPKPLPLALLLTVSHGTPLEPRNAEEVRRADRRSTVKLAADRVVRPQTRTRRDQLLDQFAEWLFQKAHLTIAELVDSKEADPESIAEWLVLYGRELFYAGRAYGRYSETINAIASRRPAFRRHLTAAWDLAFSWVTDEPSSHRPALPVTLLLAISTLALLWGWARESAIFLMAWCGILRIGEVTAAKRRDLILPSDGVPGRAFALLQIQQPKTRGVAAKHQAARIDPDDVVRLISAVFGNFAQDQLLWDLSTATLRKRFLNLQASLGLAVKRTPTEIPYDLSSLRPGGATHLLHRFEDAELVRRRGRWLSSRVCEVYLQEIAIATYTNRLSPKVQQDILKLADAFPEVLEKAIYFINSFIPFSAWPKLW